jgi:hypothetical protein
MLIEVILIVLLIHLVFLHIYVIIQSNIHRNQSFGALFLFLKK